MHGCSSRWAGFTLDAAGHVASTDPFAVFRSYAWFTMGVHSTLACYEAAAFAMAGVYAVGWLRGRRDAYHRFPPPFYSTSVARG